ncbi:MAG: hypothetical protein H6741_34135 [Alphaproteobacteria bacterium]|nr:hypothetical protein [Alphaproteobacteria bacterium]
MGIYCTDGGSATYDTETVFDLGAGGIGGTSDGQDGRDGLEADADGC